MSWTVSTELNGKAAVLEEPAEQALYLCHSSTSDRMHHGRPPWSIEDESTPSIKDEVGLSCLLSISLYSHRLDSRKRHSGRSKISQSQSDWQGLASLTPLGDREIRAGDGLQRKLDDEIPPLCTFRRCPHQQQFLDCHTDTHGLSDDKDSWTAVMEDEISKVSGHRTAVVRDQNAVLLRCEHQYLRIRDPA